MNFLYMDLDSCHTATGLVVVIDVVRAFTTAAVAFSRGALKIYPVGTVEQALEIKAHNPGSLVSGEVGGVPPQGFDFGNSPTHIDTLDLHGRILVQRTSAGTQGIVRSTQASHLAAASFVVAGATAKYIQSLSPVDVTFVITGYTYDGGQEDAACAQYIEALLLGQQPEVKPYLERVMDSHDAGKILENIQPHAPVTDLDYCTSVDKYSFAMPVTREDGLFVMRAESVK
jgi:2-phosphosulfolactate phosphatase